MADSLMDSGLMESRREKVYLPILRASLGEVPGRMDKECAGLIDFHFYSLFQMSF